MSDCTSCDRTIGMFDDHAVTLCGDCYHVLVREKAEAELELEQAHGLLRMYRSGGITAEWLNVLAAFEEESRKRNLQVGERT